MIHRLACVCLLFCACFFVGEDGDAGRTRCMCFWIACCSFLFFPSLLLFLYACFPSPFLVCLSSVSSLTSTYSHWNRDHGLRVLLSSLTNTMWHNHRKQIRLISCRALLSCRCCEVPFRESDFIIAHAALPAYQRHQQGRFCLKILWPLAYLVCCFIVRCVSVACLGALFWWLLEVSSSRFRLFSVGLPPPVVSLSFLSVWWLDVPLIWVACASLLSWPS